MAVQLPSPQIYSYINVLLKSLSQLPRIIYSLLSHCASEPLPEAKQMLAILSQDNDTLIREIRKDIEQLEKEEDTDDAGTTNFLEDMIEKKEKTAWMIRAYLEK